MSQISIQLDSETRRQIKQLAAWWGLAKKYHNTQVISRALEQAITLESARRALSDADFVGFLAELYRPID